MQKEGNQVRKANKAEKTVAQERKKAPRKKSSAGQKKAPLSAANTEHLKQVLLEKRREIVGDVNEMRDEALKQSLLDASGDLSKMPIHMADLGTDNYGQEFALELMDSERKLLKQIDEALERHEEGIYGICQGTGKAISYSRLEAKPWARYCVKYARLVEEGHIKGEPQ